MLEALTANPAVWSRTVLLVNFDENDGFFDHVPPPAPPSASADSAAMAGASTADTAGEYHEVLPTGVDPTKIFPLGKPYGLGPRVPMYVISPWSKAGVQAAVLDALLASLFDESLSGGHDGVMAPTWLPPRESVGDHLGERGGR